MTAILGQLLSRGIPSAVISQMMGKNRKNFTAFMNRDVAAGYTAGELVDFLQGEENPQLRRQREQTEQREKQGTALSYESAYKPEEPMRPGQMLSQAAGIAAPIAALSNFMGAQEAVAEQPQAPKPTPNAKPANKQNQFAKTLSKKEKSPVGLDAIQNQQSAIQQAPGGDVAPMTVARIQQGLKFGRSAGDIVSDLKGLTRKKENSGPAKELAAVRKQTGMGLKDLVDSVIAGVGTQEPAQQGSGDDVESVLNELNQLFDQMGASG